MPEFKKDIINIEGERDLVRDKNSKAILDVTNSVKITYQIVSTIPAVRIKVKLKALQFSSDINCE